MADRKVFIKAQAEVELEILVDEGVEIASVMRNLAFDCQDCEGEASVQDCGVTIKKYEITDSK